MINPYLRMEQLYQLGAPAQEPYTTPPDFGAMSGQEMYDQSLYGSQGPMAPQQEIDPYQRMMDLYKPEDTYSKMLESQLSQYPQEPQHSFKQKLLASIMGIGQGGMQRADYALHGEHQGAIQDWKNKLQPIEYLAGVERYNNANQRQLLSQAALAGYRDERNDIYRMIAEGRIQEGQQKLKIAQQRADVYEWRAKHPNHILKDVGGSLIWFDPASKTGGPLLDSGGQPVKTGSLSDQDKHNNRIEEINLRNQGAMDRTIAAGAGVYTQPDETGEEKPVVFNPRQPTQPPKTVPGGPMQRVGTPSNTYASENQLKIHDYRVAKKALETHPEWGEFIQKGPLSNEYLLIPPEKGWLGGVDPAKQAAWEAARDYIYGAEGRGTLSQPKNGPITVAGPNPNYIETIENGKRVRRYKNGTIADFDGKGWVPR